MKITEHFKRSEFDCLDGTIVPDKYMTNLKLLCKNLEVLRIHIHRPIIVLSGYRSVLHNQKSGGSKNSYHLVAQAADIKVDDIKPTEIGCIIEMLIFEEKMIQGGLGIYPGWVHYDVRGTKARWNET